jgi:hypothetical protein
MLKKEESTVPFKNKKTYQQPALRVYGDIISITASAGSKGTMDGGTATGLMMTA